MHPCCGNDLQRGTKIVAIIEIVWYSLILLFVVAALLLVFVFGVFAIHNESNKQEDGNNEDKSQVGIFIAALAVLGVIMFISCFTIVLSIVFGVILMKGSNQKDVGKCKAWLIFRIIMWVLSLLSLFAGFIPGLWEVFVTPYFIWVTYSFMKELKNEQTQGVVYHQAQKA